MIGRATVLYHTGFKRLDVGGVLANADNIARTTASARRNITNARILLSLATRIARFEFCTELTAQTGMVTFILAKMCWCRDLGSEFGKKL